MFSKLSDNQITTLVQTVGIAELAEGDVLFTTADAVREVFILQSGRMKLSRVSSDGNEKILELLSAGQSFAEAVLFSESVTYPVNATAISECRVWCIDGIHYRELLRNSSDACFAVMQQMSRRLHLLVREIDLLTLENATTRLISFLLEQAPKGSVKSCEITLDFSKLVLASRLSIKPETLSRILSRLKREGLIQTHDRTISLNDISELRRWMNSSH